MATTSVKAVPGSVRYNGPDDGTGSCCRYLVFDANSYEMLEHAWPPPPQVDKRVDWYDFRGLGDGVRVQELATMLGMPDMALEDALDVNAAPEVRGAHRQPSSSRSTAYTSARRASSRARR